MIALLFVVSLFAREDQMVTTKNQQVATIEIIPSKERGLTFTDWLLSRHSFSFGSYYNLKRLSFGTLRVINEDTVTASSGFPSHHHDNMEIVTIVLNGQLEHQDSTGTRGIIQAGDVQRMTAGKGILHSEMNPSPTDKVHFLQIWIFPKERDLTPSYEQKHFDWEKETNRLIPIISSKPQGSALTIHQDADFYLCNLLPKASLNHTLKSNKHGLYLFVIDGEIQLEENVLETGDAAAIKNVAKIQFSANRPSKCLLIEVSVSAL